MPCQFLLDSVAVRIDRHRSYQPDALVYCGEPLPDDALEVPNPIVVVEVLSPSNAMKDLRDKLVGYFQVPSIMHYLIVDPDDRLVIHHARGRRRDRHPDRERRIIAQARSARHRDGRRGVLSPT